jgi:hypothetical protein
MAPSCRSKPSSSNCAPPADSSTISHDVNGDTPQADLAAGWGDTPEVAPVRSVDRQDVTTLSSTPKMSCTSMLKSANASRNAKIIDLKPSGPPGKGKLRGKVLRKDRLVAPVPRPLDEVAHGRDISPLRPLVPPRSSPMIWLPIYLSESAPARGRGPAAAHRSRWVLFLVTAPGKGRVVTENRPNDPVPMISSPGRPCPRRGGCDQPKATLPELGAREPRRAKERQMRGATASAGTRAPRAPGGARARPVRGRAW